MQETYEHLIKNKNKNCNCNLSTQPNPTQPNATQVSEVGLVSTHMLGRVEFRISQPDKLVSGCKSSPTHEHH